MTQTYYTWLIQRAVSYWSNDEQLPLDLFAEMVGYGLNVEAEENNFAFHNQD